MTTRPLAIRRQLFGVVVLTCLVLKAAGKTEGDVVLFRNGKMDRAFSSGRVLIYSLSLVQRGIADGLGSVKRDDYFDLKAATVICQQLQFDGAYGYSDAAQDGFGNDLAPLVLEQVICHSDRNLHILQCESQTTYLPPFHYLYDVSVFCRSAPIWNNPFAGQVRLRGGDFPSQGRVEVYCNGEWGAICAEGFKENDAMVVCQQLGYSYQQKLSSSSLTSLPIWMEFPSCTNSSGWGLQCLSDCQECPLSQLLGCPFPYIGVANISCDFDLQHVVPTTRDSCDSNSGQYVSYPSNGEVMRAEAQDFNQSLLLFYHERWNFLCGESFLQPEADVACRQLGYPGGANTFTTTVYKTTDIPSMGVVSVDCFTTPDESHLLRCRVTDGPSSCEKLTLLSCVDNDSYTPYKGELRLVDGGYASEGRVEVFMNSQWRTVCSLDVDNDDTDAMCRQIGYTKSVYWGSPYAYSPEESYESVQRYILDCGHEDVCFSDCLSSSSEEMDTVCQHFQDLFVKCNYTIDYYGAGSQDECEILDTSPTPESSSASISVVDLAIYLVGPIFFILLLMGTVLVTAVCIRKRRRSSRAYGRLRQEETVMRNVVIDDEGDAVATALQRSRGDADGRESGSRPNSNLPSLQFAYALVVPPEEEYSPSYDDPIPDEPPPPYTPSDDLSHSIQTDRTQVQDSRTSEEHAEHGNPQSELET